MKYLVERVEGGGEVVCRHGVFRAKRWSRAQDLHTYMYFYAVMPSIAVCISQLRWYGSLNHKPHNSVSLPLHRGYPCLRSYGCYNHLQFVSAENMHQSRHQRTSPHFSPTNRRNNTYTCQCQRLCRRHEYTIRRRVWGYSSHKGSSRGQKHCANQVGQVLEEFT